MLWRARAIFMLTLSSADSFPKKKSKYSYSNTVSVSNGMAPDLFALEYYLQLKLTCNKFTYLFHNAKNWRGMRVLLSLCSKPSDASIQNVALIVTALL